MKPPFKRRRPQTLAVLHAFSLALRRRSAPHLPTPQASGQSKRDELFGGRRDEESGQAAERSAEAKLDEADRYQDKTEEAYKVGSVEDSHATFVHNRWIGTHFFNAGVIIFLVQYQSRSVYPLVQSDRYVNLPMYVDVCAHYHDDNGTRR